MKVKALINYRIERTSSGRIYIEYDGYKKGLSIYGDKTEIYSTQSMMHKTVNEFFDGLSIATGIPDHLLFSISNIGPTASSNAILFTLKKLKGKSNGKLSINKKRKVKN